MMRSLFYYVCLSGLLLSGSAYADQAGDKVVLDSRVIANRADQFLRLGANNATSDAIKLQGNRQQDRVMIQRLDAEPGAVRLRPLDYLTGPSGVVNVPAGRSFVLNLRGITSRLDMTLTKGTYGRYRWQAALVDPPSGIEVSLPPDFVIGYASSDDSELKPSYVDAESGTISNLLAFVFHQNKNRGIPLENVPPHELAFLLLNGTAEPLDASPPLSAESVLHLSAPGIGYSTNITLGGSGFKAKTIPAGECGQWRIPFEQILAQIPKETVEAIRAADGKLDLVWKTGDIESQLLPLILLPPTQGELDAAFLAKHADVPRIDENTDLSLDLRLAGIEGNHPVLLGTMKNNEKHSVLWVADSKSIQYNNISPSCLFGGTFYFNRRGYGNHNYGGRPHVVDSKETIEMQIPLDKYAAGQQRRESERIGGFVMAGRWEFFNKVIGLIYLNFPGDNNQIRKIHAFDAEWHKVTTFGIHQSERTPTLSGIPDLPPVAPLLAYVYNTNMPPELTCVLWNRTEAAIQVDGSRIIATNAALGYRRELSLPPDVELPANIVPATHTDWRIPWSSIIEQIPADDVARIKAADGKLDLVWQANDLTSPPLPLLLDWQGDAE